MWEKLIADLFAILKINCDKPALAAEIFKKELMEAITKIKEGSQLLEQYYGLNSATDFTPKRNLVKLAKEFGLKGKDGVRTIWQQLRKAKEEMAFVFQTILDKTLENLQKNGVEIQTSLKIGGREYPLIISIAKSQEMQNFQYTCRDQDTPQIIHKVLEMLLVPDSLWPQKNEIRPGTMIQIKGCTETDFVVQLGRETEKTF